MRPQRLTVERLEDRATPSVTAVGAEFRANTFTNSVQNAQAVAIEPDGDFVVVWHSNGQDGSSYGIYARRYNAAGSPQGSEFRVNQFTTDAQRDPAVAMDANGNFVVAWITYQDNNGQEIYARRYDAAGTPLGDEFRVNTGTSGTQFMPAVAVDPDGDFVVIWSGLPDFDAFFEIYGQRFNAAGIAQGPELHINQYTTGTQYVPAVGIAADGSFVVTWSSTVAGYDIYARRYSPAGAALGDEFGVNQETFDSQSMPAIMVHPDGGFVVAWESNGQDGSLFGVYVRRYDSTGAALGDEFRPYNVTVNNQFEPSVAAMPGGGFLLAWTSYAPLPEIFIREYAANGQPVAGQEVRINTHTTNAQMQPVVAANAAGQAVVLWQSGFQDGSEWGVYGQRFATPPRVASVRVNDGGAQRSRVADVTVTFSAQVTFAGPIANAITLTRIGGGAVGFAASVNTVGGASVVTLNGFTGAETENGSLRDGRYTMTLLSNQISSSGLALDGDNNGAAGGNYTFGDAQGLFRMFGDVNGDRRVDISDFGFFSVAYLTPANFNAGLDFNNDGRIDISDFGQFSVRFFTTLP